MKSVPAVGLWVTVTDQYITVGKIVNTHGNKGMVRVLPLTDFPERFQRERVLNVQLGDVSRQLHIEQSSAHKKFIIIKFREIPDMNAAEELKGALIQVTREELHPLPNGSFYIFQLLGLKVFDREGSFLGVVNDVLVTGANDVYVVDRDNGVRPLLVPALKDVVLEVDLEQSRMVVSLPEGLVDL